MNGCCKFTSGTSRVNPEPTEDVSIKLNAKITGRTLLEQILSQNK